LKKTPATSSVCQSCLPTYRDRQQIRNFQEKRNGSMTSQETSRPILPCKGMEQHAGIGGQPIMLTLGSSTIRDVLMTAMGTENATLVIVCATITLVQPFRITRLFDLLSGAAILLARMRDTGVITASGTCAIIQHATTTSHTIKSFAGTASTKDSAMAPLVDAIAMPQTSKFCHCTILIKQYRHMAKSGPMVNSL